MLPTGSSGGAFTRHFGIAFATSTGAGRGGRLPPLPLTSRAAHGLSLTARGLSTSSTSSSGGMLLSTCDVGVWKPLSSAAELSATTSAATGPCLAPIGVTDSTPPPP